MRSMIVAHMALIHQFVHVLKGPMGDEDAEALLEAALAVASRITNKPPELIGTQDQHLPPLHAVQEQAKQGLEAASAEARLAIGLALTVHMLEPFDDSVLYFGRNDNVRFEGGMGGAGRDATGAAAVGGGARAGGRAGDGLRVHTATVLPSGDGWCAASGHGPMNLQMRDQIGNPNKYEPFRCPFAPESCPIVQHGP